MPLQRAVLSTKTYDVQGFIELSLTPDTDLITRQRRVSSVPTLDGGVAVQDGGFAHGDRSFTLQADITADTLEILKHLHDTYAQLNLAIADGFYTTAPQRLSVNQGRALFSLLVISKDA